MASIYVLYWASTDKKIDLSDHLSVTRLARTDLLPGKAPGHYRPLGFCRYFFFANQNTVHRTSLYTVSSYCQYGVSIFLVILPIFFLV